MPLRRVYLDNSATTPVDPRVATAMARAVVETFGNASSVHGFGQQARAAIDRARREVAALIGARQNEIVFTSGGTESNNLAIRGVCEAAHGRHIVTSTIEHPSVAGVCAELEKRGWEVTRLPVYGNGVVRIEDVAASLRPDTVLITVMLANNEIGTIQPAAEIGSLVREKRAAGRKNLWFHTDAVQAAGRLRLNVEDLGCDLLTMSGHKLYAPKGVGALYVRRGVRLHGQNIGGHQERERRAGTENVPLAAAFGVAAEIARERSDVGALRDALERGLGVFDIVINGADVPRIPNTSSVTFRGADGEGIVIGLDLSGVAVSTGAACSSGRVEPSHVLLAMGLTADQARSTIRFSLSRFTTMDEIAQTIALLRDIVPRCMKTKGE